MTKVFIIIAIIVYLFLSTAVVSYTFIDSLEPQAWLPGGLITSLPTYEANFSQVNNISELPIEITKGNWNLTGGYLISQEAPSEFFVETDYLIEPIINYELNNVLGDVTIYIYSYATFLKNTKEETYFYFDKEADKITLINYKETVWGLFSTTNHLIDLDFELSPTTYEIKIECNRSNEGRGGEALISLEVNGVTLLEDFYFVSELGTDIYIPDSAKQAGLLTNQIGLRVAFINIIETYQEAEVYSLADMAPIMAKLLIFTAPEVDFPLWLNFFMWKLAMLGLLILFYEEVRGN